MSVVFTVVENQERNNGKMGKELHKLGGGRLSVLEPERTLPPTHSFLGDSRIWSTEKKVKNAGEDKIGKKMTSGFVKN